VSRVLFLPSPYITAPHPTPPSVSTQLGASGNKCPSDTARKVIIDMDSNIDDVVAIAMAFKSANLKVVAVIVTATAFTSAGAGVSTTYKLLELLGANNIDVGLGPLYSLLESKGFPGGCMYQQAAPLQSRLDADTLNGVADSMLALSPRTYFHINATAKMPSAEDVYKKAVDAGVDTVITLGSLTSLQKFKFKYPDSFAKMKHIIAMIGAFDVPGNLFSVPANKVSEFNAYLDPQAAREVFGSASWETVKLVPLDATNEVPMTPSYMSMLEKATTPEGKFVHELTKRVRDTWHTGANGFYGLDKTGVSTPQALADAYFFWDPLAIMAVIDPTYVTWKTGIFEVVANATTPNFSVDGQTRILLPNETGGRMISWASGVTAANGDRFRKDATTLLERACITDQPPTMDAILELRRKLVDTSMAANVQPSVVLATAAVFASMMYGRQA